MTCIDWASAKALAMGIELQFVYWFCEELFNVCRVHLHFLWKEAQSSARSVASLFERCADLTFGQETRRLAVFVREVNKESRAVGAGMIYIDPVVFSGLIDLRLLARRNQADSYQRTKLRVWFLTPTASS